MPHISTKYDFLRKSARVSKSLVVRARMRSAFRVCIKLFFKKVHKKLAKRYTRFARVRTPQGGLIFGNLAAKFNNYAKNVFISKTYNK